jgi:hypothetical protein
MVDTELWPSVPADAREGVFRELTPQLPLGVSQAPAELAEQYVSFMRGTCVTGQVLIVDGGSVLV